MCRVIVVCLAVSVALTAPCGAAGDGVSAVAGSAAISGSPTVSGSPAAAGQAVRPLLDSLLAKLKTAEDEPTARIIEEAIWKVWLRSGSDTVDLLMSRAITAMKAEDYPLALDLLNTIVDLKPDYAEGWNKRATVLYLLRDFSRSLQDVERTLSLEPRHFGALSGMGLIFLELGAKDKALKAFRRALAVHPFLPNAKRAEKELAEEIEGRGI